MQRNVLLPGSFLQRRMGDASYLRTPGGFSVPDGVRAMRPPLNGLPGYPASLGHVQPQIMPNRLAPSLVQYPVPMQTIAKPSWSGAIPGGGNSNADLPKMPFAGASPPYLPQTPPSMQAHAERAAANPRFHFDSRWQPHAQLRDNGSGTPVQDPSGMLQQLFLRKRSD